MAGIDELINNTELRDIADALIGFGGYGTGEELYDYLLNQLHWNEQRTAHFVSDLNTLAASLHSSPRLRTRNMRNAIWQEYEDEIIRGEIRVWRGSSTRLAAELTSTLGRSREAILNRIFRLKKEARENG